MYLMDDEKIRSILLVDLYPFIIDINGAQMFNNAIYFINNFSVNRLLFSSFLKRILEMFYIYSTKMNAELSESLLLQNRKYQTDLFVWKHFQRISETSN